MTQPKRVVHLNDPYNQPEEPLMEFRLTYRGDLHSTQRDPVNGQRDPRGNHKHDIRRVFHRQLKRLWGITPFLATGERGGPGAILVEHGPDAPVYDIKTLSARHAKYGFNFVPLVTQDLNLMCGLDILFLRPDRHAGVFTGAYGGDIDNRLKTLFDALKIPEANEDYHLRTAESSEKPFFCLLEDDKLITKVSVETDQLLDVSENSANAELVITVRLRPYEMQLGNMQFG